jgi:hypothetical protein
MILDSVGSVWAVWPWVRGPLEATDFLLSIPAQNDPVAHLAFSTKRDGISFPGSKAAGTWRLQTHSPLAPKLRMSRAIMSLPPFASYNILKGDLYLYRINCVIIDISE